MSDRFSGQTAIVTGAGSGIGRATALALARGGAGVLAVDRDAAGLEATLAQPHGPGRLQSLHADIAEDSAPAAIVADCAARLAVPNILINNAGIGGALPVHELSDARIDAFLDINLRALIRVSREFVIALRAAGRGGCIVGVASSFGVTGFRGSSVYAATKAAVIGLTRTMAADYGVDGIRVNAVAPGIIETPLTADRLANNPWYVEALVGGTPLKRIGTPEDVAAAIAFLCSDDASYISGHTLAVDGGFTATHFRPMPEDPI